MSSSIKKLYGFYRGVVKKQIKNGYCLIEIPGILEYKDIDNLPPAEPAQGICGGVSNGGMFSYPDIGANVWCFFANGDIRQPVYFAVSNARSEHWLDVSQQLKTDQGKLKGFPESTQVHSSGVETVFGKSKIAQINTLEPNEKSEEVKISKIDMRVLRENEDLDRISKQSKPDDRAEGTVEDFKGKVINGSNIEAAGEIIITNSEGGTVVILGGTNVRIHAQNIELDATNTGAPGNGNILLTAGNIEFRTTDGTIELNNSNVAVNVRNGKQFFAIGDQDAQLLT